MFPWFSSPKIGNLRCFSIPGVLPSSLAIYPLPRGLIAEGFRGFNGSAQQNIPGSHRLVEPKAGGFTVPK